MYKIKVGDFKITEEEKKAINEVLNSGRISEGVKVAEFEKQWSRYIGTKYCVAVNSGTSALMAALYAVKEYYGIKRGNVLTHKYTFVATHNAIKACGFKPIFEGKAKIAIPVHLMGYPQFLKAKIVIEDTSQAHGSLFNGKRLGSFGLMGTFSFYIAHNIQAGEMGAIVTDNIEIYRLLKRIKAHGRICDCIVCKRMTDGCPRLGANDPRFTHAIFGLNFKTMEFQAALALCQIKKADEIMRKRQENVKYLNDRLQPLSMIFELPEYSTDVSYLAYPITIRRTDFIDTISLRNYLEEKGIESRPLFNKPDSIYIGCHQYLTKEDLEYVSEILLSVLHS